jgi:hypothetical protein
MTERGWIPAGGGSLPGSGGTGRGEVVPFRRRAVKPRRRSRSPLRALVRPLAGALAVVGAPLAVGLWALTSPRFALAEVVVQGTDRIPAAWVRDELAPFAGRNLLRLPLAEVDAALAGHPWIDGVEVSKRLPRTLAVAVAERRPAALVTVGGALWFADRDGRPIAPAAGGATEGLLLVSPPVGPAGGGAPTGGATGGAAGGTAGGAGAAAVPPGGVELALGVAAQLGDVAPEWAAELTWVEVLSEEDARLHTAALPFPLVVRSGRLEPGVSRLAELLPGLARRYPRLEAVDLRFSRRIVLRPQAERSQA